MKNMIIKNILIILFISISGCSHTININKHFLRGKYIIVPQTKFNFGYFPQGYIAKHIFKLINDSGRNISIRDYYTTCGCTEIDVSNRYIPSDDSISAVLIFNSSSYFELITKPAFVETDDPRLKKITLTMIADMDFTGNPLIDIKPRALEYKSDDFGKTKEVKIKNIASYPVQISVVDYYYFTISDVNLSDNYIPTGGEISLFVNLNNNIGSSNFSPGSITLTAAIQSMPWDSVRITIPVTR